MIRHGEIIGRVYSAQTKQEQVIYHDDPLPAADGVLKALKPLEIVWVQGKGFREWVTLSTMARFTADRPALRMICGDRRPLLVWRRRTAGGMTEFVVRCQEPGGRVVDRSWSTLANEQAERDLEGRVMSLFERS